MDYIELAEQDQGNERDDIETDFDVTGSVSTFDGISYVPSHGTLLGVKLG